MEIIWDGVSYVFEKAGDGVAWGIGKVLEVVGTGALALIKELAGCSTIFAIVATLGCFVIMSGRNELGTKITSGSIITFIVCKVMAGSC